MNLTTKDLLKHSFVITINDERLKWFKKVFKFHGISPMPKKFMGTTLWYNSPQYNCYLSHKNAILKAKKLKWPYVCIFEDDAYPINNVVGKLDLLLEELPETCKVLSLGHIMLWDIRGEDGNFYKSFKSYGGHSYVVFKDAYDKFIEMLDKAPEGDGAFYSRMDDILPKDSFYIPKENLIIQYTKSKGMNNNGGYVLIENQRISINPDGRSLLVPYEKTIPEERALRMGFPSARDIAVGKPTVHINKPDKPLVFVTVNAGANTFTNITLKTILKNHPDAKVFVVDVASKSEDAFFHIDDDTKGNTEVVRGLLWDELDLPTIRLDETNLTCEEKEIVSQKYGGSSEIEVLPTGDFQHPMNIQFAMDNLGLDGFILIDNDAPLLFPVDSLLDGSVATIAEVESWNYVHLERLRPLLHPEIPRQRFCPYIQYINVKMLKEHGVKYFDKETLKDNLDFAGWFKNPSYDGKESLFFWTGSLFHRYATRMGFPTGTLKTTWYVDHFGGATWQDKGDRHKQFIAKYANLFKNQEALDGKYA